MRSCSVRVRPRQVEEHCGVTLSEAGNISAESPLLIFCKEETVLVPDVRGAIGKTRSK